MVDFRPFNGVRYAAAAGSLADLVCPPYDVISPEEERALLARSPHNMVRLELAEIEGPPPADRYAAAAASFAAMRAGEILREDATPSYYLLRQRFTAGGVAYVRHGLLGALRLEELGTGVLPHEDTAAGPKEDRLALMEATNANFSPLMMLYRDASGQVAAVTRRVAASAPDSDFVVDGQGYTLWPITDPADVAAIKIALSSTRAFIADGHHRYETAVGFGKSHGGSTDTVLTCMIEFDDPGLLIGPYYRVVHGLSKPKLAALRNLLSTLFSAIAAPQSSPHELDHAVATVARRQVALGVVEQGSGPVLLTPNDDVVPEPDPHATPADQARAVEANVLQELLFKPIIGNEFPDFVAYVHDPVEAMDMVASGDGQIAFFIKGVPADVFEVVVGAGIRLPRKSTYFHPKLPSGLVIKSLE